MVPPNWDQCFHVFVDASDIAIGSVLMQEQTQGWFWPVYYASRRLSVAEKNYSVTERECLGMIYSVKKFRHYLLGKIFYFHVDHSTLVYLVQQQNLTGKLARWMLLLQVLSLKSFTVRVLSIWLRIICLVLIGRTSGWGGR